jgi:hypothetical protein
MKRSILVFGVMILVFISSKSEAQNVSSPYSIIGIGDIESSYFNRTSGMANTGIAYRNDRYILINNPASLSDLQNQLFMIEASARGKFVTYSGQSLTSNLTDKDFSVERLSIGMRITKWWGSSMGLLPFSSSNYAFSGTKDLQGSNSSLPVQYDGTGGLNRYYFANGFRITKNLSVGVTTSYIAGSLTQQDSLISSDLSTALFTTKNIYIRNLYLEYGLQYHIPLSKKWEVSIGATYANKTNLQAQYTALVKDEKGDTLSNRTLNNTFFTLPNSTGIGIAVIKDKTLTFLADYRFQNWSSLNINGANYALVNSNRYSVGVEYSKQKEYLHNAYEIFNLQAGIFYNNSYLKVYNQQINDKGFTLGAGVNSKRSTLSYNFSFEYGIRGTKSLVREQYTGFTIGLSYKDFWYTRGKKYN